jgi:hypothetical protein
VRFFIGIDPGLTGAVATISEDGATVFDTPITLIGDGKKQKHDFLAQSMAVLLGAHAGRGDVIAAIELVHSMPEQGISSAFSFGRGFGMWEGMLAAFRIPYERVAPQRWKKLLLSDMPKDKDSSRIRAQQLFPKAELSLKKHHGRGDALLLAEFMRRTYSRPN